MCVYMYVYMWVCVMCGVLLVCVRVVCGHKHAPFLRSFSAAESTFYKVCFFTFVNISLFDPYTEDRGTAAGPLPAMSPVIAVRTLMSLCNVS